MADRVFIDGNEALARGALYAGCQCYFGYPITPQSEIPEFLSRALPEAGGTFIQAEDELAGINMVYGAAAAGARAMCSTSGLGFSLMQEAISHMAVSETPAVVVNVMRMGPGAGTIQQGQTDYRQATRGGGHGGYRVIVLAPSSPQECFDFVQLAFHLSDKYLMLALILSDFAIGHMAEPVELRALDLGPLPEKDWALTGTEQHGGRRNICFSMMRLILDQRGLGIPQFHRYMLDKYQRVAENEVRDERRQTEDAALLLVAYGSTARSAHAAVDMARAEGLRVGLLRPVTLWPFPSEAIKGAAVRAGQVLVVEDSQGQLIDDVEMAVLGRVPVHLLGVWARDLPDPSGLLYPEAIVAEARRLL